MESNQTKEKKQLCAKEPEVRRNDILAPKNYSRNYCKSRTAMEPLGASAEGRSLQKMCFYVPMMVSGHVCTNVHKGESQASLEGMWKLEII